MRRLPALATTLLTTNAFVAPPRTRLHALTGATATDDATDQLLDSWLLDNLGSCAVPIDDDDDDAFELCSVDSPTAVWKSTSASGARQFFTKSFLGDDAAVLARSRGEEPAPPRHRAGVASMAWRTTR